MKPFIYLFLLGVLSSCAVKPLPDLADIQGDHVHKEELDIYFGKPSSCMGDIEHSRCVYSYKGEILHSEGGRAYPKGKYRIEAIYQHDHLESYKVIQK